MDESELKALIAEGEHEGIDFKRELHLKTKPDKAEFVKDVISIANSAPSKSGYLIVGVDDDKTVVGADRLDEGQIRGTVDTYIQPSVVLRCLDVPVQVPGCSPVEVIEIEWTHRPYKVARDIDNLKQNDVFVRHGSYVRPASPEEIIEMRTERKERPPWSWKLTVGVFLIATVSIIALVLMSKRGTKQATSVILDDEQVRVVLESIATLQASDINTGPTATAAAQEMASLMSTLQSLKIERSGLEATLTFDALTAVPLSTSTDTPTETSQLASMPVEAPEAPPVPASLGDTWVRPADSKVMVFVPSGTLQMGSIEGDSDEQPVYTVALDGFWIDRTEVTNAHYRRCVEAGGCTPPAESGSYTRDAYYGESAFNDYPIIWINWYQAAAYCEWAGGRLPTEAEWEYTARGPEERVFPWGDKFDGTRLNYCDLNCGFDHADEMADDGYADTAPVGSYPSGISWCGALDMAGNVWEWTASLYWPYPYQLDDGRNNPDTEGARVMRGGSWDDFQGYVHASHRYNRTPGYSNCYTGFRCVSQ